MLPVALALCASLSWGLADFLGAVKSRAAGALVVLALSQVSGLAVVAAFTLVAGHALPDGLELAAAVAAGVAGTVGLGAFYRGMAVGAIGVVAPIAALAAGVPFAVGVASGERPSALQVGGIAIALAGVVLVSREPPPPGAERASRVAAGVGLAIVAALGFGGFFVFLDAASGDGVAGAVTVARACSTALAFAAALATRAWRRPGRRDLPAILLLGVFDMAANALFAVAAQEGLVSVVSVLASLYPVVTIALAHLVLHERVAPSQRAGMVAALAGVALVTAG